MSVKHNSFKKISLQTEAKAVYTFITLMASEAESGQETQSSWSLVG